MVATDVRDLTDAAIREGSSLAASVGGALSIVYVVPSPLPISLLLARRRGAKATRLVAFIALARDLLRKRVKRFGCEAEIFIESGVRDVEILKKAKSWRPDVLVVGGSGASDQSAARGSIARRLLRRARCHVLVARQSEARGRVVAATDLVGPSFPAVMAGAREARRRGAQLEVVRAMGFLEVEASYIVGLSVTSAGPDVFDAAASALSSAVKRLGVNAECCVVDRPAAAAIVAEARASDAELIVVRAPSGRSLEHFRRRRVAEQVMRTASCSVLVLGAAAWST
jgi:nucleotide-binding universal stress UspA family protein